MLHAKIKIMNQGLLNNDVDKKIHSIEQFCGIDDLHFFNHIKHVLTQEQKLFLVKICENDTQYLKNNYHCMDNEFVKINNCVIIALACSNNPDVIKLLVDLFKVSISDRGLLNHSEDTNGQIIFPRNCSDDDEFTVFTHYLILASILNPNVSVIKYLIEECKMDPNHECKLINITMNCLSEACVWGNYNIAKYLIDEQSMDSNHLMEIDNSMNCEPTANQFLSYFEMASCEDVDIDLMLFLIDRSNCKSLSLKNYVIFEDFEKYAPLIRDPIKLNHLVYDAVKRTDSEFDDYYDPTMVANFIKTVDRRSLDQKIIYFADSF